MNDRMTTAREALTNAAKAFREYETHHNRRAFAAHAEKDRAEAGAKAERNRQLAEECEGAAALLTAQ